VRLSESLTSHSQCASPLRVVKTNIPVPSKNTVDPISFNRSSTVPNTTSRIPAPKTRAMTSLRATTSPAPVSPTSSGIFICGGCHSTVFQMEKGVVTDGKDWKARKEAQRWKSEGSNETGCGKKLDSQARTDWQKCGAETCMVSVSDSIFYFLHQ
jgi:hypothetical protein